MPNKNNTDCAKTRTTGLLSRAYWADHCFTRHVARSDRGDKPADDVWKNSLYRFESANLITAEAKSLDVTNTRQPIAATAPNIIENKQVLLAPEKLRKLRFYKVKPAAKKSIVEIKKSQTLIRAWLFNKNSIFKYLFSRWSWYSRCQSDTNHRRKAIKIWKFK